MVPDYAQRVTICGAIQGVIQSFGPDRGRLKPRLFGLSLASLTLRHETRLRGLQRRTPTAHIVGIRSGKSATADFVAAGH